MPEDQKTLDELEITLVGQQEDDASVSLPAVLEVTDEPEDRYSRLRLIPWWDQDRLRAARVMVVGAGALGNEILKNLALLGVGHIFVVDLDTVEQSNLSRSILYRASDEGAPKAEVAAARVREINPDVRVRALQGDISTDVGLGVFRAMDVVIGGLDNREARLAINQACWKVNRPWIDGAIEVLHGVARVFVPPNGPCYECTLNSVDYRLLNMRKSCALLNREQMLSGKVPTTPTTSSVIAGIQTQEAVKLLHAHRNFPLLAGRGFFFNGLTHDSYVVTYARREDCPGHETFGEIREMDAGARTTTLGTALAWARDAVGSEAVLELGREIATAAVCRPCGTRQSLLRPLARLTEADARCPSCGEIRVLEMTHTIYGTEDYLDLTLADVGVPILDIVTGRSGWDMVHFELSADREEALGDLA